MQGGLQPSAQQARPTTQRLGRVTRAVARFFPLDPLIVQRTLAAAAQDLRWARLRKRMFSPSQPERTLERAFGYEIRTLDGPNFYIQLKDEFVRQIYWFPSPTPSPLIVDAGSNIGMSILYFKKLYPDSSIIAFEPDPVVFDVLSENVSRNDLRGVKLVKAAVGPEQTTSRFTREGGFAGGAIAAEGDFEVSVDRLSNHIDRPVDLVKLNVEGAELSVIQELVESGAVKHVTQFIVEYHAWPGAPSTLAPILSLLDQAGYTYVIHDFSGETNPVTKPPITFRPEPYFLLIYARRGR